MARARYEIGIGGVVDPADLVAFSDLEVAVGSAVTTLTGSFDQAALHGLIARIEALGLELVEIRRVRPARRRQSG